MDVSSFGKSAGEKDGLNKRCKHCDRAKTARWYLRNKEKKDASDAKRALENPGQRREIERRYTLKRYGVSLADYQAKIEAQEGCCAICGTDTPRGRGAWAVDHDHDTGGVRGLLCMGCNTGLGHLKDSPTVLASALRYLAQHGKALSTEALSALLSST